MRTQLQHTLLFPDSNNDSDIAFQQGVSSYEAGYLSAALDAFTKAINISTHYHQHYHYQSSYQHLCLANAYSYAKEWLSAIEHYNKAIFQEHNNQLAFKGRSHAYKQLDEHDKAAADIAKITNPETTAYPHLYIDDNEFRTAIGAPNNYICASDEYARQGLEMLNQQLYTDAIHHLKMAIDLSTEAHDHYHIAASSQIHYRALVHFALGEEDLAMNDAIKALDLNRKNTSAIELKSIIAEKRKS